MCIAILNPKSKLPKNYLRNSWANNNQGAGLLYVHNGNLCVFKSYKYPEFESEYYRLRSNKTISKIVLHFRIATSGHCQTGKNLHPFLVSDKLGFVHNGVISGLGNKSESDTFQFNEMLKILPNDFLSNKTIIEFIETYTGWSKLIFLDSQNNHTIINEIDGHYDRSGNWFSNDSYQNEKDYVYYGNKKVDKKKENFFQSDDFFERDRLAKMLGFNSSSEEFEKETEYYKIESGFTEISDIIRYLNDLYV